MSIEVHKEYELLNTASSQIDDRVTMKRCVIWDKMNTKEG